MKTRQLRSREAHACNMGLAIAGGHCLIEVLCFYQTSVLTDSLVLRNARHRQAPNRCASFFSAVRGLVRQDTHEARNSI